MELNWVNWGEWKIAVGLLSRSGVGVPHFFFRLGGSGRVFWRGEGKGTRGPEIIYKREVNKECC